MRLFIAVQVPESVKKELMQFQEKINVKIKFVKEFHLTLKFLGEIPENNVEEIKENLRKVQFESFNISLDKIGFFPNEDYIRVVWVGLSPVDKINELQQKVDSALNLGKEKKFHPHLTLARIKFKLNPEIIEKIKALKVPEESFTVNSFYLIKSTLTREGPIYEVLEEFKAAE
ncbi:RNA 2',3'-cyclic phosphodiesterase [Candidatus Woesearchaeota archaeon]|nr:RNA 2',3'-cyclic phosphodiesterase [Candidatus Woesearchaeota archaeon]